MATIAEQLTSLANTKTAIKDAIVAKGVTVADDTPFSGYPAKIGEIQGGGGGAPATKFGVSIDNLLGDVDENGYYTTPAQTFEIDLSGITYIKVSSQRFDMPILPYMMYNRSNLVGTVDLSNFMGVYISTTARNWYTLLPQAFVGTGVTKVILPREINPTYLSHAEMFETFKGCTLDSVEFLAERIGGSYSDSPQEQALRYQSTFANCTISKINGLYNIKTIGSQGLWQTFSGATLPEELHFDSLTTVKDGAYRGTFTAVKGLLKVYYPSLTDASVNAFSGTYEWDYKFYNNTVLTEMHFRADMQATIEAMTGYSTRFGAKNATIYFDLIGTITVGGVAYARDEKQSIRVDGVKTFVGWKDADGNVVYTSYADNAEPAVGTAVYSDAGTTQVGTVEGVA